MNQKELEEKVIGNYQSQEKMMILVFAQWCINHDLEPEEIYLWCLSQAKREPGIERGYRINRTNR